jgi:uncharacterized protein YecE (DUF72 family)
VSGNILVGTASWTDPGFVDRWYPKGMAAADRLPWYAQQFEMVEINSTFYSVPDPRTVERWCRSTPEPFTFDVKLHQLLSRHSTAEKMLPPAMRGIAATDAKSKVKLTPELERAMVKEFTGVAELLRAFGKLGALLLQLSPAFSPKMHALAELDEVVNAFADYKLAIEFRNRNWVANGRLHELLEFCRDRRITLVSVDAPREKHFTIMPPDLDEITNPQLTYLRLHGRDARAYTTGKTVATRFNYDYTDKEIDEVAERSEKLAQKSEAVHVIFNNNALDHAPHAAARLRAALGQIVQAPARTGTLL